MNFKKIIIAVAAILFTGVLAFVSCSKEKTKISVGKKHTLNQFEEIGKIHNKVAYEIGMAFKEDLHKIVLDGGISDKDALELRGRMEEWARSYCTSQVGNTYEHFVKEWNVDVEKLWMTAMDDTVLNNILDQATSLEELLEVIRKREEYVYKKMKTIGDTTKLVSLVVLRNSIQFWNDAYCNPSNPWHEIIYYMPLQTKTKGKVRDKFNKWVQEKAIPYINRTVAALVVGAASDYATALVAVPITAAIGGGVGGVVGGTLTMLGSVGGAIGGWSGANYLNDQP